MWPRIPSPVLVLVLLLLAVDASAHSRGETWSFVNVSGDHVDVTYVIQATELAQHLPEIAFSNRLRDILTSEVLDNYHVRDGTGPCTKSHVDLRQSAATVEVTFQANCTSSHNLVIENDVLFTRLPNHLHIAQATIDDVQLLENLFTDADRTWQVTVPTGLIDTLTRYLELGVTHIVTGYDHMAFLLAVMLLTPRAVTLVLMITGFTIGHSITLALAVLGYANASSGAVEALIGFTIALVAAEVVARRHALNQWLVAITAGGLITLALVSHLTGAMASGPNSMTLVGIAIFSVCYLVLSRRDDLTNLVNPALTLLFGMIHGFGFAGLLMEIGLPRVQMIPALIGFNLGVEAGQLLVLAVALAGVFALRRYIRLPWYTTDAMASILCGLGLFWFVSRSF